MMGAILGEAAQTGTSLAVLINSFLEGAEYSVNMSVA